MHQFTIVCVINATTGAFFAFLQILLFYILIFVIFSQLLVISSLYYGTTYLSCLFSAVSFALDMFIFLLD